MLPAEKYASSVALRPLVDTVFKFIEHFIIFILIQFKVYTNLLDSNIYRANF